MPKLALPLPRRVLDHLCQRVAQRHITAEQLADLQQWILTDPEVPGVGVDWYKRFAGFILCGRGPRCTTILEPGQLPHGTEVR